MAYTAGEIGELITATAALGTASYGLVDVSKAFGGGISKIGYGRIKEQLTPFKPALDAVGGWSAVEANWLNGMDKAEQKKRAKESIRLGVTAATEPAVLTNLSAAQLVGIAALIVSPAPTDAEKATLARFDTLIDTRLDAAFEGAEQRYKSAARFLAALLSVALAEVGAALTTGLAAFDGTTAVQAFLIGVVATPIAPVAKDLSSALATAVTAFKAAKA